MTFPSLYKAKAVAVRSGVLDVLVPQVFGETMITVSEVLGLTPDGPMMGWVFFQAGNPEFPVWSSGMGGGGDGGPGPPGPPGSTGPPGPQGPPGSGGGTGADEVWVGPTEPADPAIELWYDTDEPSGTAPEELITSYVHIQSTPASVWVITHPLAFNPNVSVIDSANTQVEGDVVYTSSTVVTVTFSAAFSGRAYLS